MVYTVLVLQLSVATKRLAQIGRKNSTEAFDMHNSPAVNSVLRYFLNKEGS
jgi:hypothetical protein